MDHRRPGRPPSVADGPSPRLEHHIASWRREFRVGPGLGTDDLDELCDHFRETVAAKRRAGQGLDAAVRSAREEIGDPRRVTEEMGRVASSPRAVRRWCAVLITYAVVHATWILLKVGGVTWLAFSGAGQAGQVGSRPLVLSVGVVLIGVFVLLTVARSDAVSRRLTERRAIRSTLRGWLSLLAALASAPILFLGVVLIDYWEWWIAPAPSSASAGFPTATVLVNVVLPAVALTAALAITRWHPALRRGRQ